jgi:hypothetical protein
LSTAPYEACEKVAARVSSLALVRYRGNDYSAGEYGVYDYTAKELLHSACS